MEILDFHHLGLTVSNLPVTTEFFTKCLGWSIAKEIPEYPAAFVTNGKAFITLWQSDNGAKYFDNKGSIGLHHFALEVASEKGLYAAYKKVSEYPGVKVEFGPEILGEGPTKHCIFYEPGGIRMEFIWVP